MKFNIKALSHSASSALWLIVLMTIIGEMSAPFKAFLTSVAGHHWVTKGIFSIALFVISYYFLSASYKGKYDVKGEISHVVLSAVAGGVAITAFYIWHYFA